jgi:hypothetical protein
MPGGGRKKTTAPKGKSKVSKPQTSGKNRIYRQDNTSAPKKTKKPAKQQTAEQKRRANAKANKKKAKTAPPKTIAYKPKSSGSSKPNTRSSSGKWS